MQSRFSEILCAHIKRYPLMLPQDFAKLAYQSEFGPEHMIVRQEHIFSSLLAEWEAVQGEEASQPPEAIGNGLCRFHLNGAYPAKEAAACLANLFEQTATIHTGSQAGLLERLDILPMLGVPGMTEWLARYKERDCPPIPHSQVYRDAYHPHYRLLRWEYAFYFPALLPVWRLVQTGRPAIVAIDGCCGSGKTSLSTWIQALFPCHVFHLDDFYLPPNKRAQHWQKIAGGNIDFNRFLAEALMPTKLGQPVSYRRFDCHSGYTQGPVHMPFRPLTIVEGSYSHHPILRAQYAFKIFLTCSKEEQTRRLQAREGACYPSFEERWIPMEEQYFRLCATAEHSELILDTTSL